MQHSSPTRPTTTERVRKHRAALREAGLKPVQLWLPDTRSAAFRQKCARESQFMASDPLEAEILSQIAEVADTAGWQ